LDELWHPVRAKRLLPLLFLPAAKGNRTVEPSQGNFRIKKPIFAT
jgi:hypothetical protein